MLLKQTHFDLQILNEHVHGIVVLMTEGYDEVSMLHCWLYKVIVGGFDEPVVLSQHIHYGPPTLCDIPLNLEKQIIVSESNCPTYFCELALCHQESVQKV